MLLVPEASADGPGYGGGADRLAVSWDTQPPTTAMGLPVTGRSGTAEGAASASDLRSVTDDVSLSVNGVGFRGLSAVEVRVGSGEPFEVRTDATGTLAVRAPASSSDAVQSGTSVVAIGRSPSGTTKTLVGSVPPRPDGIGPVDLVPWVAAGLGVVFAGSWLVGVLRRETL